MKLSIYNLLWKVYISLDNHPLSFFRFLGSGPDRGQSPVEWGDFPFIRPSVHPSVRLSIPPLEVPRASQAGLRPSQSQNPKGGREDKWMNGWMENLPILQDFVHYQSRCPATAQL